MLIVGMTIESSKLIQNQFQEGILDFEDLVHHYAPNEDASVLNGIAHIPETDEFWITGKNWPTLHLISLNETTN